MLQQCTAQSDGMRNRLAAVSWPTQGRTRPRGGRELRYRGSRTASSPRRPLAGADMPPSVPGGPRRKRISSWNRWVPVWPHALHHPSVPYAARLHAQHQYLCRKNGCDFSKNKLPPQSINKSGFTAKTF